MNLWAFDARGTVFPASRQGAKRGDRRKEQRDRSLASAIMLGFGPISFDSRLIKWSNRAAP